MSSDSYIPIYKRSGDGLAKDILKLKKIELISEGWYKGQVATLMEKVAGKIIVDGVECYSTNVEIAKYCNPNDNSTKAKDVRKLLKLFGMSDSSVSGIYETLVSESTLKGVKIHFNKKGVDDREFTLSDFKKTYTNLVKLIADIHKIEIINSNKTYLQSTIDRPAVANFNIYNSSAWIIDKDYYGELQKYETMLTEEGPIEIPIPIVRDYSIGQAMHFTEIKVFNSDDVEINDMFNEQLLDLLKMVLMISGDRFIALDSVEKLGEEVVIIGDIPQENMIMVTSKETYTKTYSSLFYGEFDKYKKGSIKRTIDDGETYIKNGILAFHYWDLLLYLDSFDGDTSNDLFYVKKRNIYGFAINYEPTRYMTVGGLKKTNAKELAFQISLYLDFQLVIERKKKKFFGIGGFVGSFLGGLLDAVVGFVIAIASLSAKIPIVKLQYQVIGWIFSGKWSSNKDWLEQVATRVLLAAIAAVITVVTFGYGWQLALSLVVSGITMFNGLKSYSELVESAERQKQYQTKETEEELYDKLVDFSNDEEAKDQSNYSAYSPFDKINKIHKSPFDKGGIYSPKFGL